MHHANCHFKIRSLPRNIEITLVASTNFCLPRATAIKARENQVKGLSHENTESCFAFLATFVSIGLGGCFAGKVVTVENEIGNYPEMKKHANSVQNKVNMSVEMCLLAFLI